MTQEFYSHPLEAGIKKEIVSFLNALGLTLEEGLERTLVIEENGEIIATGSRQKNVLKCIGVKPGAQGEGLSATLVSALVKDAATQGHGHLFLFTKPETVLFFNQLGFYPVARTNDAALMENRKNGVAQFVQSLPGQDLPGVHGAIVANCNPFTKGHLYLVEQAKARCDVLHLFILSEDQSLFTAQARFALAVVAVKDIPGVFVHPTEDYLISAATFPAYFLKEKVQAEAVHGALDVTVFATRFAVPMNITTRFVGTEPLCATTNAYNASMREILPRYGVQVAEIPRLEIDGAPVSASRVRALIEERRFAQIQPLVPKTTYAHILERFGG